MDNPTAAARIKVLEEKGRRIPDRLYPPDIQPGAAQWLEDFFELGTDRQLTGYGAGPIPAGSIERHIAGWPYGDAEMFRYVIRALDGAWLKRQKPDGDAPESDNPARDAFRGSR